MRNLFLSDILFLECQKIDLNFKFKYKPTNALLYLGKTKDLTSKGMPYKIGKAICTQLKRNSDFQRHIMEDNVGPELKSFIYTEPNSTEVKYKCFYNLFKSKFRRGQYFVQIVSLWFPVDEPILLGKE